MKQHMLTHKIRDMPQHMFDKPPSISSSDEQSQPGIPREQPLKQEQQMKPEQLQPSPAPPMLQPLPPPPHEPPKEPPVKRELMETELPLPKRPPSKLLNFGR